MANPKSLIRKVVRGPALRMVENTFRKGRGVFWQARYGFPARGAHVIAITGTNGKTTTASYVNSVLRTAGLKTAVYTTAYVEINGERLPNKTHMTVSSEAAVQRFFADAKAVSVDWIILEITSHALDQGRGYGIPVEIAVITNLTQEHLDYHGTMDHYAAAKARLLGKPYNPVWSVLNADDEWFDFFKSRNTGQLISYGESPAANLRLKTFDLSAHGSHNQQSH